MQELGLLDLFPYLAMGLSGDKLDSVQHNPGKGPRGIKHNPEEGPREGAAQRG